MRPVVHVLHKAIVARFYEQNAGLFLFAFFLMFGIVESSQIVSYHLSLIAGIIESTLFLAFVNLAWLIYLLKSVQFVLSRLTLPENEFLFSIGLMDARSQSGVLLFTLFVMDLPVLVYSLIVVVVAVHSGHAFVGIYILSFHLVLLTLSTLIIQKKINATHLDSYSIPRISVRWTQPKPFALFYLNQLTDQLKTVMVVTKAFSILAILGFLQIPLDTYDVRVVLMGILFAVVAHTVIVFEFRRFEDRYLSFTRNLPLSSFQRFGALACVYSLLLVPETILLWANRIPFVDAMEATLLGTGFIVISHCSLYLNELDMDRHIQKTLWLFLGSFMIVLCKFYRVEAVLLWVGSFLIFNRFYYTYEGSKG